MLTLSAIKENPQEIIRRLAVKHFDAEQLINEILDFKPNWIKIARNRTSLPRKSAL